MKNNKAKSHQQSSSNKEDKEHKLEYGLIILGLDTLIPLFKSMKLTFIDFLLLSKQDVIKLNLELYQRNRIINFIQSYQRSVNEYSFDEIITFFNRQRQFIFIQLQQPITHESASLVIDKLLHHHHDYNAENNNPSSNTIKKQQVKPIDKAEMEEGRDAKIKAIDIEPKRNSYNNNPANRKQMIHSQTVDPSLKKVFRGNDNPFYQSYIKMNKDTDNLLDNLRKSKEESECKHLKYLSLLDKNSHNLNENNSSGYANTNSIKEDDSKLHSGRLNENNIKEDNDPDKMSYDMKKLYEMLNKKESLIRNLNECNKSITEKKKVSLQL